MAPHRRKQKVEEVEKEDNDYSMMEDGEEPTRE